MKKLRLNCVKVFGKFVFNGLIILALLLGQVSLAYAQDGGSTSTAEAPTETVTLTPEPTDLPTDIPTELPTEITETPIPTEIPTEIPTVAPTELPGDDISILTTPANDNIANATVINPAALPYQQIGTYNLTGRGVEASEPRNVCNAADTGSVWYSFTPTTTGIYLVTTVANAGGSFYSHVSVFEKGASANTPVICGSKNATSYTSVSFYGAEGKTYLISISDQQAAFTGTINFILQTANCPANYACTVFVGGDGTAPASGNIRLSNSSSMSSGSSFASGSYNNSTGFIQISTSNYTSGTIKAYGSSDKNLFFADNVPSQGVFNLTNFGLPANTLAVKGASNENLSSTNVSLNSATYKLLGATIGETDADGNFTFYAPAGSYELIAESITNKLIIYNPSISISSSASAIALNASTLPRDRITFDFYFPVGTTAYFWTNSPNYNNFGYSFTILDNDTVTLAAPAGTHFPYLFVHANLKDANDLTWDYGFNTGYRDIVGGTTTIRKVGGTLTYTPTMNATSYFKGMSGTINSNFVDQYSSTINQIYYFGYPVTSSLDSASLHDSLFRTEYQETNEGTIEPIQVLNKDSSDLTTQEWVWENAFTNYSIKDSAGTSTAVPTDEDTWLSSTYSFTIPNSAATGTATLTGTMDYGPYTNSISTKTKTFSINAIVPVTNDAIASAKVISTLPYSTSQSTMGATVEAGELASPCNTYDTNSVWYKFKPSSAGIYKVNVFGSNYDSGWNRAMAISVYALPDGESASAETCADVFYPTDNEYRSTLSFYGNANTTYLIGFSTDKAGGQLKVKLEKQACPSGHLCAAAVGGDGRAISYASAELYDVSDNQSQSINTNADNGGFVDIYKWDGTSLTGTYDVNIYGSNTYFSVVGVKSPGIFKAYGVGLVKTPLVFKNYFGSTISQGSIFVKPSGNDAGSGGWIGNAYSGNFDFYAPAGDYDFEYLDDTNYNIYYLPDISIVPGDTKTILSSGNAKDTIDLDIDQAYSQVCPGFGNLNICTLVPNGTPITLIAPVSMVVPINYQLYTAYPYYDTDWSYLGFENLDYTMIGGNSSTLSIGHNISITPVLQGLPYRKDETTGLISSEVKDDANHHIYYGYTRSSSVQGLSLDPAPDRKSTWWDADRKAFITGPVYLKTLSMNELSTTSEVSESAYYYDYLPNFTIKDPLNVTHPILDPIDSWFQNSYAFSLVSNSPSGTWSATAAIDLSPFTSGTISNTTNFSVVAIGTPSSNDLIANAQTIDPAALPFSASDLDTTNATNIAADPVLPCVSSSKGNASIWYKFTPTQDGKYLLDTAGSSYDTVLAVWTGTPTLLKNVGCNDYTNAENYSDAIKAKLQFDAKAGTSYYVEVAQPYRSDYSVGTLSVGGMLDLKLELVTPCYSVITSQNTATGGNIQRTPTPDCLATEFTDGTEIRLQANPAANFGFQKWSDSSVDNPYVFTLKENKNLQAFFIAVPGAPALSSPADKALTFVGSTTLRWGGTTPVSDHYVVSIAKDQAFSLDKHDVEQSSTSYSPDWLEENTIYYWTVRGVSAIDQLGPWSAIRSFRTAVSTPILSSPADLSLLDTNRPVMSWDGVSGATGYTIQISTSNTFATILNSGNTVLPSYTPTINMPASVTLYWRVQAKAVNGPGAWSLPWSFTAPAAPPIPALSSPANAALSLDYSPDLKWSAVVIPLGNAALKNYEVQVSSEPGFSSPLELSTLGTETTMTVTPDLDPNRTYFWRVRAMDVNENYSGWSLVRTLRTSVEVPELSSPSEGENIKELRPTFDWNDVPGATGYVVQVYKTVLGIKVLSNTFTINLPVSNYLPTVNLAANQTLYWRVQAKAVNGPSDWSPYSSFIMPNPPSTPTQVSPANSALAFVDSPYQILDWSDSTIPLGAGTLDHYTLWVSDNSGFSSLVVEEDTSSSNWTLDSGIQANKTYYWKVKAINSNAEISLWSSVRTFRTAVLQPVLNEPIAGITTKTNRPDFDWDDVAGATGYTIQIAKDSEFKLLVATGTSIGSFYVPTTNMPVQLLYWRVQSKAVNGPSRWSSVETFTAPLAPSIPTLTLPSNNALNIDYQPLFDWSDVVIPITQPALKGYDLDVANDAQFSDIKLSQSVSESKYQSPPNTLDPNKTYYWRVRAVDTSDNFSGWSAVRVLRSALDAPENLTPADAFTPDTLKPILTWDAVTGATGYSIQISKNNTFTSMLGTYATVSPSYTPTANLPANVTLWWRVQSKGVNGPSAWSVVQTLTMPNPPSAPTITSPANNATVTTKTPKLDWSNSTLAVGVTFGKYELEVADNSSFLDPVFALEITNIATSEKVIPSPLLNNTTYYWRVRACNASSQCSAWMSTAMFKISIIDTLKVNGVYVPDYMDPQKTSATVDVSHLKLIYEGLTELDENLVTIPGAASSWIYNDDATQITFNIRPNLKYSDGSVLNAKRFEYAIMRTIDPKTGGDYAPLFDVIKGAADWRNADPTVTPPVLLAYLKSNVMVKAYDTLGKACTSYTQVNCLILKITFNEPVPYFHSVASLWVTYPVKEEKVTSGGENWWRVASNLIGNGPFKITSFNVGSHSNFIPNTNYWGGIAKYNIQYSYIADDEAALTAYNNGELDITPLTGAIKDTVDADVTLSSQSHIYSGSCTTSLMFNQNLEPFNDIKVREAFAYALDRQSFVDDVLNGLGQKTLTWIPEGFPGYDATETRWDYNQTNALQAITDSSYGSVAALPDINVTIIDNPSLVTRWNWLRTQFIDVFGSDLVFTINPVDSATYYATENQLKMSGWCGDFPDPQNWLSTYWKTGGFGSSIGYSNSEVDDLLYSADISTDAAERLSLYQQAQKLIIGDAPMATIWNKVNSYLVDDKVKNFVENPMDLMWTGDMFPLKIHLE